MARPTENAPSATTNSPLRLVINADPNLINERNKQLVEKKVSQKLARYLKRFDLTNRLGRLHLGKKSRFGFWASLKVNLPGKKSVFAKAEGRDLTSTLVAVREQTIKQIRAIKEKITDRKPEI